MNKAKKIGAYKRHTKFFTNHLRIFMKCSGIFTEYASPLRNNIQTPLLVV